MNKKIKSAIILVVALVLMAAAALGYLSYQNDQAYHAAYIVIDDIEYERSITSLDFSGKTVNELDKLKELSNLESLNLRNTGISIEQYEELQSALPDCDISWSVPFQGTYYDNDIMVLDVSTMSAEDLDILPCFGRLQTLRATHCTDYDNLVLLMERHPNLNVTYSVEFSGEFYANYTDTLTIANPNLDEIREKIKYLPNVTTINMTGTMPDHDEMLEMREAFPGIAFGYDFEVFGVTVNSFDEMIDLSGAKIGNIEEVEAILPYFYNLKQVDMVDCDFSNKTMDSLNKRHRDIKFVWTVSVCGIELRTDAKYFMPVQHKIKTVTSSDCQNLKYCPDIEVIDLGHYGTGNVDFVEHMPNLKYLLLCESVIDDLSAISNCISLEYLELQCTKVTDFWPLTNLTNLRDLNLAGVPCTRESDAEYKYGTFGDYTPLLQMTWLNRLWLNYNGLDKETQAEFRKALPNTVMVFQLAGHTTGGFRYTPRYFEQRDILGMYYSSN